jgi:hypothetical protein
MGYAFRDATDTTSAVAGTTAGMVTFDTPARCLYLRNGTGQPGYFQWNTSTASATTYDYVLAANEQVNLDARDLGIGNFGTVGIWLAAGATWSGLVVRGA